MHARFMRWDDQWFKPLAALLEAGTRDSATVVFPLENGSLRIECAPPKRSLWPKWLRWPRASDANAGPTLEEILERSG